MSAPVGTERMTRDIMRIVEEVLEHVVMVPGGTARINIEIELDAPAGIPAPTVRTLKENCKNLGILGVDFY